MTRLRALAARRPGPVGLLLVPTWVLLGAALVLYVLAMLAVALLAVVVATLRLFLTPPATALARAPGVRAVVARVRLRRYARDGVAVLESRLRAQDGARRRAARQVRGA